MKLSRDELTLLTLGLWHWEDLLRRDRATIPEKREHYDDDIRRVRRLKRRILALRARTKGDQFRVVQSSDKCESKKADG